MIVSRLTIDAGKAGRIHVNELMLSTKAGVMGDVQSARDGSVTLIDEAAADSLTGRGLCEKRFHANIVTRGLAYALLSEGDTLDVGGGALVLTRVGKRCFDACELRAQGQICQLKTNCAFARVVRGGAVHAGDSVLREGL